MVIEIRNTICFIQKAYHDDILHHRGNAILEITPNYFAQNILVV